MAEHSIIEDRIEHLNARALEVQDDEEARQILTELRALLREQIRRVRDRTKEVMPVLKAVRLDRVPG